MSIPSPLDYGAPMDGKSPDDDAFAKLMVAERYFWLPVRPTLFLKPLIFTNSYRIDGRVR